VRLNGGQKAVLCVALGAVLILIGLAVRSSAWSDPGGGWFNDAPNNGVIFSEDPLQQPDIAAQLAMWVGLVVVWTVGCLLILRSPRSSAEGNGPGAPSTP